MDIKLYDDTAGPWREPSSAFSITDTELTQQDNVASVTIRRY